LEDNELLKLNPRLIEKNLWLYQEYDNQILEINDKWSLLEKADFIRENEFPIIMENTDESEFICLNLKIPCLFIRIKNQEKQAEALETAKKFKHYF